MAASYQNLRRKRQQTEEKMAQLQTQLAALRVEEEQRLGQLAARAGLLELDLSDEQWLEAFGELVQRFRDSQPGQGTDAGGAGQAGEPAVPTAASAATAGQAGTAVGGTDDAVTASG